ncbi:uncharacterized protein LOC117327149 [Pecten maximus]|uniref:uncharacterized protein LOC117327149 n=1 Tax=Pecten maximus TaxID=6579 RepID=UPI001458504B|nr:uncharacterized protein LOC117327149 [Pecten maximus]
MLAIFVLLGLAASLSPAAGLELVKNCDNYKPFVSDWICENNKFNPLEINKELITGMNSNRRRYDGFTYIDDTKDCVVDIPKPKPVIAKVATRHRRIKFEELCRMEKIPIWNVFENLSFGGRSSQFECIVIDTDWMRQELYYARCMNPVEKTHDKCQMDYGAREEFRCIQSGFVEKRVLVYCPDADEYIFTTRRVPTTCSCRKCFHCESADILFADLLAGLGTRFELPVTPIKAKPLGCNM